MFGPKFRACDYLLSTHSFGDHELGRVSRADVKVRVVNHFELLRSLQVDPLSAYLFGDVCVGFPPVGVVHAIAFIHVNFELVRKGSFEGVDRHLSCVFHPRKFLKLLGQVQTRIILLEIGPKLDFKIPVVFGPHLYLIFSLVLLIGSEVVLLSDVLFFYSCD